MKRQFIPAGLACVLLLMTCGVVEAAIPTQLAWQGVVLDSANIPLANGLYTFHFAIFTDDIGGDSLWGESQTVEVENGVLSVFLGRNTPIADSAFAGPTRFLQVQFEDQAPYVPRTRIVSVGYAYRASSVDGALGGSIVSSVEVAESVTAPALLIDPAAATGAGSFSTLGAGLELVRLDGAAGGGQGEFYDELGNATVSIAPDPDGEGGMIAISGDAGFTTGITLDGNNGGSLNPQFTIVGANPFHFNSNVFGDEAVSFPVDAISAPEILDEPGLAVGVQPSGVIAVESTFVTVAGATSTYPANGYAMIFGAATFRAYEGNTRVDARLVADGQVIAEFAWDSGDPDQYLDQRQSLVFVESVVDQPRSYELHVRTTKGRVDVGQSSITALYVPTAYGSVPTASLLGFAEGEASPEPLSLAVNTGGDLSTEEAASILANQERIAREIDVMQARLLQLKADLTASRILLDQE